MLKVFLKEDNHAMSSPLMTKASGLRLITGASHQLSISLDAIIICQLIPITSIKEAKSSQSPLPLSPNVKLRSSYRGISLALAL
jgi:hypothetical protein